MCCAGNTGGAPENEYGAMIVVGFVVVVFLLVYFIQ